jgi:AcrR family transcriptional regulator
MTKRSEHSYRELRDLILDAAYDIVEECGVSSLSARSIASKINYSVGTLYNIFANMNDIILYLNSRVLDHFIIQLSQKLDDCKDNDAIDNLMIIAKYYLYFSQNHYHLWHMLFINKFKTKNDAPKWYNDKITSLNKLVSNQISMLNSPDIDLLLETSIYWASVHGVVSLNNSEKLRYTSQKNVEEILELVVLRIFKIHL